MSSLGSPSLAIDRQAGVQRAVVVGTLAILMVIPLSLIAAPAFGVHLAWSSAPWIAGALLAIALAGASFWRIGWLGGRRAIQRALWSDERAGEDDWQLWNRSGERIAAALQPSSQLLGAFVWLRFKTAEGPRELLLLTAFVSERTRRHLVTRLRLAGHPVERDAAAERTG